MGYCVSAEIHDVVIPGERVPEMIEAFLALMGRASVNHYSWVHTEAVVEALDEGDLVGTFNEWRYEVEMEERPDLVKLADPMRSPYGDVFVHGFHGEKLGDDAQLWQALAPFIRTGGIITWTGEDGAHWRYVFEKGECKEQKGEIVWR